MRVIKFKELVEKHGIDINFSLPDLTRYNLDELVCTSCGNTDPEDIMVEHYATCDGNGSLVSINDQTEYTFCRVCSEDYSISELINVYGDLFKINWKDRHQVRKYLHGLEDKNPLNTFGNSLYEIV